MADNNDTDPPKEERVIIDMRHLRQQPAAPKELDADLVMEIDLLDGGYQAIYLMRSAKEGEGRTLIFQRNGLTREALIDAHVEAIKQAKPKTALVRSGRHSSGHVKDILLHPGVVKSIVEGKLGAGQLLLRG